MTENLLQKLEEKMMVLLSEVEDLRKEVRRLNDENSSLKVERENQRAVTHNHTEKLRGLIELLDTVTEVETTVSNNITAIKPVLMDQAL